MPVENDVKVMEDKSTESSQSARSSEAGPLSQRAYTGPLKSLFTNSSDEEEDLTLYALSPKSSAALDLSLKYTSRFRELAEAEKRVPKRILDPARLNQQLREILRLNDQQRNGCGYDATSQWVRLSVRIKRENPDKLIADCAARKAVLAKQGGKAMKDSQAKGDAGNPMDIWTYQFVLRSGVDRLIYHAVQPLLHRLGYTGRRFVVTAGGFLSTPGAAAKGAKKSKTGLEELLLLDRIGSLAARHIAEIFINFDGDF